jgi:hypothetical protein
MSVRGKAAIAALVLVPFLAFSLWVAATHGALGFLSLARDEPWALQLLLDLAIALSFAIGWLLADARRRGIAGWPYAIGAALLGSPVVLLYVIRRGFTPPRGT